MPAACMAVVAPLELLLCGMPSMDCRFISFCGRYVGSAFGVSLPMWGGWVNTLDTGRELALALLWLNGTMVGYWGNCACCWS